MPTLDIVTNVSGLGGTIAKTVRREADAGQAISVTVPAGKASTAWTKADDNTGTATLAADHGIETGQVVDVYWSGGFRAAVTVGTVSGTSVPLGTDNSGSGDNYPVSTTAIVVSPRVTLDIDIDPADLQVLSAQMVRTSATDETRGTVRFVDTNPTAASLVLTGSEPQTYDLMAGAFVTSPIENLDPVVVAYVSQAGTSAATLTMLWLFDA